MQRHFPLAQLSNIHLVHVYKGKQWKCSAGECKNTIRVNSPLSCIQQVRDPFEMLFMPVKNIVRVFETFKVIDNNLKHLN